MSENAVDLDHDGILSQIFATPDALPYWYTLDNDDRPVTHFQWERGDDRFHDCSTDMTPHHGRLLVF